MAGNFILDSKGFAEMAVGPEIAAAVLAEAKRARAIAEGFSADFVDTGNYVGSFETYTEVAHLPGDTGGRAHDAVVGVLINTASNVNPKTGEDEAYAVAVEYGFKGRSDAPTGKARRVFGRTLAALEG